jgi:hypothetical protein
MRDVYVLEGALKHYYYYVTKYKFVQQQQHGNPHTLPWAVDH